MKLLKLLWVLISVEYIFAQNATHPKPHVHHRTKEGGKNPHPSSDSGSTDKMKQLHHKQRGRQIHQYKHTPIVDNGIQRSTTSPKHLEELVNLKKRQNDKEFLFSLEQTKKRLVESMGGVLPHNTKAPDFVYNAHSMPFEEMLDVAFVFESSAPKSGIKGPSNTPDSEAVPEVVFENWRSAIEGFHVIILGDDEIVTSITIPEWMKGSYEIYTRSSLIKTFVEKDFEGNDAMRAVKVNLQDTLFQNAPLPTGPEFISLIFDYIGLYSLAAWVSDREFIYIIDNTAIPIEPAVQHSASASSPSSTSTSTVGTTRERRVLSEENSSFDEKTAVPNDSEKIERKLSANNSTNTNTNSHSHSKLGAKSSTHSQSAAYMRNRHMRYSVQKQSLDGVVDKHIANLRTPATPFYFNTLGDAYLPGNDFPHSYPFHLRGGVSAVLSQGSVLGDKHYDPVTRFMKTSSRGEKDSGGDHGSSRQYVDHTTTIPHSQLFSLNRANMAFNRNSIGAVSMFYGSSKRGMPSLAKSSSNSNNDKPGSTTAIAAASEGRGNATIDESEMFHNYHDIIVGWILKIVIDECSYGAKSGAPYVYKPPVAYSDPQPELKENSLDLHNTRHGRNRRNLRERTSSGSNNGEQKAGNGPESIGLREYQYAPRRLQAASASIPATTPATTASDKPSQKSLLIHDIKSNFTFLSDTRIYEFFRSYRLDTTTPSFPLNGECGGRELRVECVYTDLATALENSAIGKSYKYFKTLASFMKLWVVIWQNRHAFLSSTFPRTHASSLAPTFNASYPKCAMITIVHNEEKLLPLWIRYHMKHFHPSDIYILDHITDDNSTHPSKIPSGINLLKLEGNRYNMPVLFRSQVIKIYQDRLLRAGYACVLFSDTDEIVVPNPTVWPGGLKAYLEWFAADPTQLYRRVTAWELGHISYGNGTVESQEPTLDWSRSILAQRGFYAKDTIYNKPLLSKEPMTYRPGFHRLYDIHLDRSEKLYTDPDLIMFHLRSLDATFCLQREEEKYNMTKKMEPAELNTGFASHWNKYEQDKKSGELCKYAVGCFLGPYNPGVTKVWDNTGVFPMIKLEEYWKNVDL